MTEIHKITIELTKEEAVLIGLGMASVKDMDQVSKRQKEIASELGEHVADVAIQAWHDFLRFNVNMMAEGIASKIVNKETKKE